MTPVVMGAALASAAFPVDAGLIISDQAVNFTAAGQTYAGYLTNETFPILSGSDGVSVGGVVDGGYLGKYGAGGSASASANLSATFQASQFQQYDLAYKSNLTTSVVWDAGKIKPNVGDSIFLGAAAAPVGITKLTIKDAGIRAFLQLSEAITLSASGMACVYGCVGFNLGVNIGGPSKQNLLSINEGGSGDLKVLGQTVAGTLPYTYASPDGSVKISAGLPDFSSAVVKTPTLGSGHYDQQKNIFSAGVDFAQLFATAIGLPFPLSGNLLGFDYTLLSVIGTVGVDLQHVFDLVPVGIETVYGFSSPVRVRDPVSGLFGAPVSSLALAPGETAEIRAAGMAQTLGILPEYRLAYHVAGEWNLLPFVAGELDAIEVSGYGLSLGPALEVSKKLTITELDLYDTAFDTTAKTTGKAINVLFDPMVKLETGDFVDVCAGVECLATGFLPETAETGDGWSTDAIFRVTDLVNPDCGIGGIALCGIDLGTDPVLTQHRRVVRSGVAEEEYAEDGALLQAILDLPDPIEGPTSDETAMRQALRELGFDPDNLVLPPFLGVGAPPLTEPLLESVFAERVFVPEPSALALAVMGLLAVAGLGAGRPRCRRQPATL
ncbi:MAG: hypothetical protein U1E97_09190 [Alphaproteobacteria bacterium]